MEINLLYWIVTIVLIIPATVIHFYGKIWNSLLSKSLDSEVPEIYKKTRIAYRMVSLTLVILIFFIGPLAVYDYEGAYRIYGKTFSIDEIADMAMLMRWIPPLLFQFLWAVCLFCCWSLIAIQYFAYKSYKDRIIAIAQRLYNSSKEQEEFIKSMLNDDSNEGANKHS